MTCVFYVSVSYRLDKFSSVIPYVNLFIFIDTLNLVTTVIFLSQLEEYFFFILQVKIKCLLAFYSLRNNCFCIANTEPNKSNKNQLDY